MTSLIEWVWEKYLTWRWAPRKGESDDIFMTRMLVKEARFDERAQALLVEVEKIKENENEVTRVC